jgi:hypothetical protein
MSVCFTLFIHSEFFRLYNIYVIVCYINSLFQLQVLHIPCILKFSVFINHKKYIYEVNVDTWCFKIHIYIFYNLNISHFWFITHLPLRAQRNVRKAIAYFIATNYFVLSVLAQLYHCQGKQSAGQNVHVDHNVYILTRMCK